MTDIPPPSIRPKIDRVLLAIVILLGGLALFDLNEAINAANFAAKAILHTAIFIVFAILLVAYMKASGAEHLLAKAFNGAQIRMIILAALVGGLSPFCSCEVIPFIAALLALGTPLAPVMAFWLASPLMDPAMFVITAGTLGLPFAIGKTVAAVTIGLLGGFTAMRFASIPIFLDPLRKHTPIGCCGVKKLGDDTVEWQFWHDQERMVAFRETAISNGFFLLKWLGFAYVIEALMLAYIPAERIAGMLGGDGIGPILLGALVGAPAYLNGYAAIPLVDALLVQGMSNGAAMSFVIAGGVSCIPAALAVWALVKPRVFAAYLGFAMSGAVIAGLIWQVVTT